MIAFEVVRHRLALVVRVDDHFTMAPASDELAVALDSQEVPGRTVDNAGTRHADGTYRFFEPVTAGVRQVRVTGPTAFTWNATTAMTIPLADPKVPLVIETWPTPDAPVRPGTLAIRGRVIATTPAAPVAPGQQVTVEVVGAPARGRRARCDASGEFLFVVVGTMALTSNKVELDVKVTGRAIASIAINGAPAVTSSHMFVPPGRETRALIKLS